MYIISINYFRGIAIIFIVIGHCISISHWLIQSPLDRFIKATLVNSTVYFIFISGFLCQQVYFSNFNYLHFLFRRTEKVLFPYLTLTIIPVILAAVGWISVEHLPEQYENHPMLIFFWLLGTGTIIGPFWFIPMVMLIFIFSPLAIWISNFRHFSILLVVLLLAALFVHRPHNNINPFHEFCLFFPIFLLGIAVSKNTKIVLAWIKGKRYLLFIMAILITTIQSNTYEYGIYHKNFFEYRGVDLNTLQKIIYIFFLYSVLDEIEKINLPILKILAKYSFPIYFLHSILIQLIQNYSTIPFKGNILYTMTLSGIIICTSIMLTLAIKGMFGSKSNFLIGV